MAGSSFYKAPSITPLYRILDEVRQGLIRIPRFQRPFVWDDEQRLELLDSIYRGYPIGSFLTWRSTQVDIAFYDQLGPFKLEIDTSQPFRGEYLLDGHQRLTTLYTSVGVGIKLAKGETPKFVEDENYRWPIYFDLRAQHFTFYNKRSTAPNTYLPLHFLFSTPNLFEFMRHLDEEVFVNRAENLAADFRDYSIPITPMVTNDLDQVTTSFQRVNSKGTPMSEAHMIAALTYNMGGTSFDLNEAIANIRDDLEPLGWAAIDERIITSLLKLRFELNAYRKTSQLNELVSKLRADRDAFSEVHALLRSTISLLGETCQIYGPKTLPYLYQLVIIADTYAKQEAERERLSQLCARWFYLKAYTGEFGGASDAKLNALRAQFSGLVTGEGTIEALIESASSIDPVSNFQYKASRSMLLALHMARHHDQVLGARDALVTLAYLGNNALFAPFGQRNFGIGFEARFIVPADEQNDFKIKMKGLPDSMSEEERDRHFIPRDTRWVGETPTQEELEAFFVARRELILASEEEFIRELGLTPAPRSSFSNDSTEAND